MDASTFKTVSVEKIDGKDYNVLSSDEGKFHFDPTTGLLYKLEAKEVISFVKSHKTVEGILFPDEVETPGKGQKVIINITKMVINSDITDADFK